MDTLAKMLASWLAGHTNATLAVYIRYAFSGLVGGAALTLFKNPALALPQRVGNVIKLGFVGTLAGGALWGVIADNSVPVAMVAGMLGPTILDFVLYHALPAILRSVLKTTVEQLDKDGDK
jgi:hypothetical protein